MSCRVLLSLDFSQHVCFSVWDGVNAYRVSWTHKSPTAKVKNFHSITLNLSLFFTKPYREPQHTWHRIGSFCDTCVLKLDAVTIHCTGFVQILFNEHPGLYKLYFFGFQGQQSEISLIKQWYTESWIIYLNNYMSNITLIAMWNGSISISDGCKKIY